MHYISSVDSTPDGVKAALTISGGCSGQIQSLNDDSDIIIDIPCGIWTSSDAGNVWTKTSVNSGKWKDISISGSGQYSYAVGEHLFVKKVISISIP